MGEISDYRKLNIEDITYGNIKRGPRRFTVPVLNPDNESKKLRIQTPRMKCVKGFGENNIPYYCECEFPSQKNNHVFYDFMANLEYSFTQVAFEKSTEWFNKELNLESIEDLYKNYIKASRSSKSQPLLKLHFPTKNGELSIPVFNQYRNRIQYNEIPKSCEISAIIECPQMSFSSRQFQADWNIIQLKVYIKKEKLKGYSFIENDDDDDDDCEDEDYSPQELLNENNNLLEQSSASPKEETPKESVEVELSSDPPLSDDEDECESNEKSSE